MEEEKQDGNTGRPFQLRPSILSGSGFGSSGFGGFGCPGDKTSKEFTLRPSALTSATDHLESTLKSDSRKRLHEDHEGDPSTVEEEETTKKVKTTGENGKTESPVKLTEDVQKPSGIGTFGFGKEASKKKDGSSSNKSETTNTNFFQTDSNKFAFGHNSNAANTVGFNTLKSENDSVDEDTDVAAGSTTNGEEDKETGPSSGVDNEKLLESADVYQKSLGQRTHLKEVEPITGEEGERNVLQVFCKLHLFDKAKQNWLEKGRGTLKLNDKCHSEGIFQSRLVFRTQGTNIVLLNMMLWPNMCCERVKEKSIRITEIDSDSKEVKVYLVTTAIKDCLQTYIAIDRRIEALKRNSDNTDDNKNDATSAGAGGGSGGNSKAHSDDEDSSTESERISSRENSMYGPTDNDSSDQTSPGQTT